MGGKNDVFQGDFVGLRCPNGWARLSRVNGLKIGFSAGLAPYLVIGAIGGQISPKMLLEAV